MFRKLLIAAVAAGATLGVFATPDEAEARNRGRVYIGPNRASVRWGGGYYNNYRPRLSYYRPYNRGLTFSYGQPYYGGYYNNQSYGYGYGYSYPQQGVYYRY